jgi:hypothetical protein
MRTGIDDLLSIEEASSYLYLGSNRGKGPVLCRFDTVNRAIEFRMNVTGKPYRGLSSPWRRMRQTAQSIH